MPCNLLILGSGSQARYVLDILAGQHEASVIGIADMENPLKTGGAVHGVPIVCFAGEIPHRFRPAECRVIIAYGKNDRKREIAIRLEENGFQFATVVSPMAYVSPSARIGEGCIINPLATVMPDARIGRHVILHSQAVIEHDNVVGDYVNVAPGVSLGGNVHVGEGTYLYTGASIIPKINVGRWVTVGAGAVVIRDVPDFDVVAGVPAKSIRKE